MTEHPGTPAIEPNDLPTALIELRHAREEIARLTPFVAVADGASHAAEHWEAAAKQAGQERDEHKRDYLNACKTIADMHAAAVGEVRGPARGVVEDVEDVRLRAEQAEAAIDLVRAIADRLEGFAENALREDDRKLYAALARDIRIRTDTIRALDGTEPPAPAKPIVDRPFRSHRPKPAEEPGLVDKDGEPICTCTSGERCPNCRD